MPALSGKATRLNKKASSAVDELNSASAQIGDLWALFVMSEKTNIALNASLKRQRWG